ncbi:hypothetical protein Rsub_09801 [Raphidocelis subcapitata]|uniref:PAS domain-containing protein n=1 Tax=Raphidocelis subcapitata TaxID=307507 RepID=A0A2V0PAW5_9CHLO|nr:hypothetical protein Rsub_09801 [Raphidocelis subcapitata]|eukprot:GBF97004.1 hypothetical protein Rsub_09801 [Raphidocelis subcapitata]
MSESGDSSRQSFSTGASSAASDTSDAQALNALQDRSGAGDDENINDLISGNRGVSEAIFATLVLLGKNRSQQDLRWVALRIVLEFLQARRGMFRVVFNTEFLWSVNRDLWAFQAIRWVLFRFLVLPKGYSTYIVVFYVIAGIVFLSLALTAYVAVVLKKDDSTAGGWLSRLVQFMQLLAMVMYSVAWVSILDFLVFMFACHWEQVVRVSSVTHTYFGSQCLAMPHLAHMAFAVVVTLVFMFTCLGLSVGDCDLNPLTRNMVMVVLSTAGGANPRLQAVVMAVCSGYITYQMIMAASYYSDWVNHVWNGLWCGIVYTCILLNVVTFRADTNRVLAATLTWAVLWGIFGAVLLGAGLSALRLWWLRRPLEALRRAHGEPEEGRVLKNVYRFRDTAQARGLVEVLARVMRKWDVDGQPDEEACALGEFVYKCGMARFPNDPTLLITLANFYIEARKDGQGARTQLQLAVKAQPSLIQRFFIYKTQDLAKKLKESGGLDLMGYIEFQRGGGGRLLKIYGRFLEWVRNEPSVAQKYYVEAMKQGMGESLLALIGGGAGGAASGEQEGILGSVDEKTDAIVIINASGIIMAVNRAAFEMFGYQKGELESKNVSCLMPQPFSGRHNGYISHYVSTGRSSILNASKQLVAVTKAHIIFPINLTIVKLSGAGQDCIFMGAIRSAPDPDPSVVRLWAAPVTGTILCADERFADNFGVSHAEVAGRAFSTLGPDIAALERLIEEASATPPELRADKKLSIDCRLLHKFLPPVDARVTVEFGGTSAESILILNIQAMTLAGAMMVVDHKGRIAYATSQLGALLGYSARQLAAMDLASVELGNKPPATSCRVGAVVHLLRSNGVKVPVTLALSTHDDGERLQHVVRITPSSDEVQLDRQRMVLRLAPDGRVESVNPGATRALFGFNPSDAVGQPLRSVVNVFGDWAKKMGEEGSLLTALGVRALEGADESWRVGVMLPGREGQQAEDSAVGGASLLASLQQRTRVRPAILQAEVAMGAEGDAAAADAGDEASLSLVLWRADAVTAVMELDRNLSIVRADPAAGLLFGMSAKAMIKKDFRRLACLPKGAVPADLLTATAGAAHGKKSGLKSGAAPRVGVRKVLRATHADGGPLALEMQAVLKQTRTSQHLVLRLQLAEPSTGSVEPLLALKGGANAAISRVLAAGDSDDSDADGRGDGPAAAAEEPPAAAADDAAEPRAAPARGRAGRPPTGPGARNARRGAALEEEDEEEEGGRGGGGSDEEEEEGRGGGGRHSMEDPRRRVAAWVKETDSFKRGAGDGEEGEEAPACAKRAPAARARAAGEEEEDDDAARAPPARRGAKFAAAPDSASEGGGSSAAGGGGAGGGAAASVDQSASQVSGSEAGDGASSAVGDAHADEELAVDFRRAKRLKKLNRMMTSSAAQSATTRFKRQTWAVIAIILGAHVTGYAVLSTQIEKRFENMHDSATMARATDRFQLSAMRINFAQKCSLPEYTFINCGRDVLFHAVALGAALENTSYYQYMAMNGPESIFDGYSWSLDVQVDMSWLQLASLNTVLIVLLVVEALAVQLACMAYQFLLVRAVNAQHMRRFSVFLALPSATVRVMAARRMVVDDDGAEDADEEEEMEALTAQRTETGAAGAKEGGEARGKEEGGKPKSVRMAAGPEEDEGGRGGGSEEGGGGGGFRAKWGRGLTRFDRGGGRR